MFQRRSSFLVLLLATQFGALAQISPDAGPARKTFCNPLNLPYNFQPSGVSYREAADPVIVLYKDKYWLFASKQTGYWFSDDMVTWNFVKPEGLPLDVYAPSVTVVNGDLCYTSGNDNGTFTTNDPAEGKWVNVNPYKNGASDPDVFQDSDGKVYLYDGCSDQTPLRYTPLDPATFLPAGPRTPIIYADPAHHGWEVAGDHNRGKTENDLSEKSIAPWIEGSFMNKIGQQYYLQYSAPGTQFNSYGDGVYTSGKATGPFVYQPYSPFSFKPTGFITGAGHSCTFADKDERYWHIATGTISIRHMFERRLVLFPTAVLSDGQLVTDTYLGDYPQFVPAARKDHLLPNAPQWMLLSYKKPARASSVLTARLSQDFSVGNAFDENIRSWWSAATGNPGEWLQVDLLKECAIYAVQSNFADQDCAVQETLGNDGYQYLVEASADGEKWFTIVDRAGKAMDTPHDYVELDKPVRARYLRIKNIHFPAKGLFSLYDLRVFGIAPGNPPPEAENIAVLRNVSDLRSAHISWKGSAGADFYIVRYGIAPDRLYGNYQVYSGSSVDINALNIGVDYYFAVDAVNATGITKGTRTVR